MIAGTSPAHRAFTFDRPAFQWDASRGTGPLVVRLFGALGSRELEQITLAVAERGRSPRDLVCLDFEQVTHVDFRALPEFARTVTRQIHRGADVCFMGMSGYVRDLFDVSGQGPVLRRLEWMPVKEAVTSRRPPLGLARSESEHQAERRDIWR